MQSIPRRYNKRVLACATAIFLVATPMACRAGNPFIDLVIITLKASSRAELGAAGEISAGRLATKLAVDSELRSAMLSKLAATGDKELAEKLGQAWGKADSQLYKAAVQRDAQIVDTIRVVGVVQHGSSAELVADKATKLTSSLIDDALGQVPLTAFESQKSLEDALLKAVTASAQAESKSASPRFTFEVATGKLSIPAKLPLLGGEVSIGEINLYKVASAAAAAIACGEIACVQAASRKLFGESDEKSESPAETFEKVRRAALQTAAADDPLHQYVVEIDKITANE